MGSTDKKIADEVHYKFIPFEGLDLSTLDYHTYYVCKIKRDYKNYTPDQMLRFGEVELVLVPISQLHVVSDEEIKALRNIFDEYETSLGGGENDEPRYEWVKKSKPIFKKLQNLFGSKPQEKKEKEEGENGL